MRRGFTLVELLTVVAIVGILVGIVGGFGGCFGVGGCGPSGSVAQAKVTRLWVDNSGERGSAYMVATDKGVFEVDNGLLLGMWNADELYGKLQAGHVYSFQTKGRKIENLFMQEYPRIVKAVELVTEAGK